MSTGEQSFLFFVGIFMTYALYQFVRALWFSDSIKDKSSSAPVEHSGGGDGGVP
jgi:hypothetical protein